MIRRDVARIRLEVRNIYREVLAFSRDVDCRCLDVLYATIFCRDFAAMFPHFEAKHAHFAAEFPAVAHVSPTGRTRFKPPSTRASATGFPSRVEFRTMDRGAP